MGFFPNTAENMSEIPTGIQRNYVCRFQVSVPASSL